MNFTGKGKRKSRRTMEFLDYIDKCAEYDVTATKKRYLIGVKKLVVTPPMAHCPGHAASYCVHTPVGEKGVRQTLCENCGACGECCDRFDCDWSGRNFKYPAGVSLGGWGSTWFIAMQKAHIVEKVRDGRTYVYVRGKNALKFERGEF